MHLCMSDLNRGIITDFISHWQHDYPYISKTRAISSSYALCYRCVQCYLFEAKSITGSGVEPWHAVREARVCSTFLQLACCTRSNFSLATREHQDRPPLLQGSEKKLLKGAWNATTLQMMPVNAWDSLYVWDWPTREHPQGWDAWHCRNTHRGDSYTFPRKFGNWRIKLIAPLFQRTPGWPKFIFWECAFLEKTSSFNYSFCVFFAGIQSFAGMLQGRHYLFHTLFKFLWEIENVQRHIKVTKLTSLGPFSKFLNIFFFYCGQHKRPMEVTYI